MKYLCVHGHFYQPPRENPWLETIELQDSAYPYHDWNERVSAECYAPNAATRILDGEGKITRIVNNYSQISFNFGPTLLSWAKDKAPELHERVVEADKLSRERFGGHGSAMAQAFNHMIMPLANSRDKRTQILWGIEDFKHRFGRDPEGMWLAETAVDLETLDIMAEAGIKFTVLAQYQAHLIRQIGAKEWVDVTGGRIDPARAYRLTTPGGRKIVLFFYDGPISRAVAFEGLLNNGHNFAQRLMSAYSPKRDWPELAHIATDGESYGHHHRYGEMALAYALHEIEEKGWARITNYGEYLALHPPTHEVEIYENTAWSCAHGIGRWMTDCGCNSGGNSGWNQKWRGPLRAALDWLRDETAPRFQARLARFFKDPWAARNDYIHVMLDRTTEAREAFLRKHGKGILAEADKVEIWKLLELQRHAMLMYTSCGWFFDEISGIETVQVIQYAGRVVQLAQELFDPSVQPEFHYAGREIEIAEGLLDEESLESRFLERLALAKSNLASVGDGAKIYEKTVRPAFVDLRKVGAHYAISSVFNTSGDSEGIYCYTGERQDFRSAVAGHMRMVLGRAKFTSEITQESGVLTFGVLHFGDHNVHGGVRPFRSNSEYERLMDESTEAFSRADVPQLIRAFDRGFGHETYSVRSLFRDEQRTILGIILTSAIDEAEGVYRRLYENHVPLMRFLGDLKTPLPKAFKATAEYALNSHLRRAFAGELPDVQIVKRLLEEARLAGVDLDSTTLEFTLRKTLERLARKLAEMPTEMANVQSLREVIGILPTLPFRVALWTVQNICWSVWQECSPDMLRRAAQDHEDAKAWVAQFRALSEGVALRIG